MPTELSLRDDLLRVVLDTLPIGVVVMNANGDIVTSNRAAERMWGGMIEDCESRLRASHGWWHASGERVQPHEWGSVRALSEGVAVLDQIIDVETHDGKTRRTIRNSAVPLRGQDGAIEGAVVLNEDITERLDLEARLAEAEKLEAVGRLAGGVAHDFNNLLMVIHGYGELLQQTMSPDDPRHSDLGEVRKASESAADLTRQLLAFGRREVRRPRHVEVEACIRENETLLRRAVDERVQLVLQLASPGHVVFIDPVQLQQVLLNLVLNARDAMPSGGLVTVSTSADAETVVIAVRDTGTGMEEQVRARIFEPFYTTKTRTKGTGLGLSTVYGIVQRAGGSVRVDTELGRGTTFSVVLPIAHGDVAPATPHVTTPVGGTESILLVEDATPARMAVTAMLTSLGYRVHAVGDAAAALAYHTGGGTFDLVITDAILPGTSGRVLVEQLRVSRPDLRALFISGYADGEDGTALDPLLPKPFTLEALAGEIRDILDARQ